MTSRTTRKRARVLDFVFVHELAADSLLVAGRLVPHGGDEFARSYVLLGVAVTVETPLHLERVLLPGKRHPVHSAMAALTTHALVDVNTVIEIYKVRQIVDASPPDGLS